MSTMPSVGSGTYAPGPNMVCSPQQEKVGTGSIEASTYSVYIDLRGCPETNVSEINLLEISKSMSRDRLSSKSVLSLALDMT